MTERTYTEREVILRERAAFRAGTYFSSVAQSDPFTYAKRRYPLPKRTQPRVVEIGNKQCRLVRGKLQVCVPGGPWWTYLDPGDVAVLRDLLNNPTEEVPHV